MRLTLLMTVLLAATAFSQPPAATEYCHHPGDIDRSEYLRVTSEAKINTFDGKKVEWLQTDRVGNKAGEGYIDDITHLPEGFAKDWKRKTYLIIFCIEHRYIYQFQYFDREAVRKFWEERKRRNGKKMVADPGADAGGPADAKSSGPAGRPEKARDN